MKKPIIKPRNSGPHKGMGGRPEGTRRLIYDDPDRWVIVTMLWLRQDPKERRSIALIEALDNLLTPHDGVELVLDEPREIEGVEHGVLGILNQTPDRVPDRRDSNKPDRRPRSAPGGAAFCRSRLQHLQAKIARFKGAKLTKKENGWMVSANEQFADVELPNGLRLRVPAKLVSEMAPA